MAKASKRTQRLKVAGTRDETRQSAAAREATESIVESPPPKVPGTPTTRYATDPLGGNKRAHQIVSKRRAGWSTRKIARHYQIRVEDVDAVLRKAGLA